jgi:hypothetical protein
MRQLREADLALVIGVLLVVLVAVDEKAEDGPEEPDPAEDDGRNCEGV